MLCHHGYILLAISCVCCELAGMLWIQSVLKPETMNCFTGYQWFIYNFSINIKIILALDNAHSNTNVAIYNMDWPLFGGYQSVWEQCLYRICNDESQGHSCLLIPY